MSTLKLIVYIALTHVRFRVRQTLVAVAGVATGVGFSIVMAALMQGSQADFTRQLIDALPHITVSDELRKAPVQPAETAFDAAEIHGLTPEVRRRGINNPMAIMATLETWVPGAVAPATKSQALIRYANRDVGASVQGIDPHREPKVSMLATQMRVGTLASLYRASNAIILGNRLAEKIGARLGSNITVQTTDGARITAQVVGLFRSGIRSIDESTAYVLVKTAQILAQQTGLVNEIRVRVTDPMAAASWRSASSAKRATNRWLGRRRTRTCSVPSLSATSSCTRSSARFSWWRASASTTSSQPSRTRRRATLPF